MFTWFSYGYSAPEGDMFIAVGDDCGDIWWWYCGGDIW